MTTQNEAQSLARYLKRGRRAASRRLIPRKMAGRANTAAELEEAYEDCPPPNINLEVLDRIIKDRGRRSGGRKWLRIRRS